MITLNFIRDPNVGIFARAKRKDKGVPATLTPFLGPGAESSDENGSSSSTSDSGRSRLRVQTPESLRTRK